MIEARELGAAALSSLESDVSAPHESHRMGLSISLNLVLRSSESLAATGRAFAPLPHKRS